jgi:hypothetical protein
MRTSLSQRLPARSYCCNSLPSPGEKLANRNLHVALGEKTELDTAFLESIVHINFRDTVVRLHSGPKKNATMLLCKDHVNDFVRVAKIFRQRGNIKITCLVECKW